MPLDKPIKIVGFNWKRSDSDGKTFAGIQIVFSNGSSSPLFLARNTSANNLQWVSLASDQQVRKIKGQQGQHTNVNEVYFYDKDDKLITQMVSSIVGGYDVQTIEEGEELIGVYSTKNALYDNLDTLGFIVWTPNRKLSENLN